MKSSNVKMIARELGRDFEITNSTNIYDLSMDIHCEVGHLYMYDNDIIKAIELNLNRKLTESEISSYYEAKEDSQ